MALSALVPGPNNLDLERERAQCSFSVEEFAQWWYGGAEKLRVKRERGDKNLRKKNNNRNKFVLCETMENTF